MKAVSPFKTVAILGVGLIGGSIGLGLKKYAGGMTITGIGRSISRLKKARALGAVDNISVNLRDVTDQDLVILAQPVAVIKKTLARISGFLKKGAVVIDVAGTKEGILKEARRRLPSDVHFIGTHPLAGSEKMGVGASSAGLFRGTTCVVIGNKNSEAFKKAARVFKILGANVTGMTARKHDELVALISHIPHLVAQALVGTVGESRTEALKLASSGFRDTTRIAESSPEIWRDIFIENKKNIFRYLTIYENELKRLRRLIDGNKKSELRAYLARIKKFRSRLNVLSED